MLKYVELYGILSDFLNNDTLTSYGSGRRKTQKLNYFLGTEKITLEESKGIQIEIDDLFHTKKSNILYSTEAKNKFLKDFNISQLFFPFYYYSNIKNLKNKMSNKCLFIQNCKVKNGYKIQIFEYEFKNEMDITSISLIKNKEYKLTF